MKTVKIYGPGCKRCEATEAMVREAAAQPESQSMWKRCPTRGPSRWPG